MILLSHPTGNANVRHALGALKKAGMLSEFVTTLAFPKDSWLLRLAPDKIRKQLKRRAYELPADLIDADPLRECLRLAGLFPGSISVDSIYQGMDRRVARRIGRRVVGDQLRAVYCYEDGAYETFAAARASSLRTVYDLPIGYWKEGVRIQAEEAELQPEWASTMPALQDSAEKHARKDEELRLADLILVASSFTARTLSSCPSSSAPVHVIPYGAPPPAQVPPSASKSGKLRVLYVGALTQRKGLSYLFRAMGGLEQNCELTLIGQRPRRECTALGRELPKWRWLPSLGHAEVLEEMRQHHVLVFPSLFEGFGLVILEAMSQGMTVVTTPNTAGPDVITDGVDGFLVPIRSAEEIRERLLRLSRDRDLLYEMRRNAWLKATCRSWHAYQAELVDVIERLMSLQPGKNGQVRS